MRGILFSLLLCTVAFTTGCPQGPSKNFPGATNGKSLVANINSYLTLAQNNYNAALIADPTDASQGAQQIRNDAIEDALAVIDDNYTSYISSIESRRSSTDFLLDVIDLGTGAATGIAKGERPNQILGIAMTAFRGGRKSAELNFYKQQTTPILISKMDDNRNTLLVEILQSKSKPVSDYSLKAAIRDLVNYFNGGTLVRAFTELSKTTGAQALASQNQVSQLRRVKGPITVSQIPSVPLHDLLVLVKKQRISLAQQVQNAVTATPMPPANLAQRNQALQPIRMKLESIWTDIENTPEFAAAIATVNADVAKAAILANIHAVPPVAVSEINYLTLINALQTALNDDLALNQKLLMILVTNNP
jgi:hypothetical protein